MKHYKRSSLLLYMLAVLITAPVYAQPATPQNDQPGIEEPTSSPSEELGDYERHKTIERSIRVSNNHQLKISNSYGKVQLINWDRPEMKVTVRITAEESSAQRAETALERVHIIESNQGQVIGFETKIDPAPSNWWSRGSSNSSLSIDYQVYLPKSMAITIQNRYGATEIADRDGAATLSIGYGSLTAGRLMGRANTISISYSQAKITALSTANASVKYSKLDLGTANKLKLSLSYSSGSKIGTVHNELDASVSYSGKFQVGLGNQIKNTAIKASYSGVEIQTAPNAAFDFDVSARYGQFNYDSKKAAIHNQTSGNTSKSLSGSWNNGGSGTLRIQSAYGNVSLK